MNERSRKTPRKDPPNLTGPKHFSLDRLLSHVDPSTAEETEEFVRMIREQRNLDLEAENAKQHRP